MNVFIAGDSTAAIKVDQARPEYGWGEKINNFFTDDVEFFNHSVNGLATKTFISEGHLDNILSKLKTGDYVFIQFGHNDSSKDNSDRYSTEDEYVSNLNYIVEQVSKKGAIPVILSSVARRHFIGNHQIDKYCIGNYPYVARKYAKKKNLSFLNIFLRSKTLIEFLGDEKSTKLFLYLYPYENKNYPEGIMDNTHLNEYGALVIASVIARAISQSKMALKEHVIKGNLLSPYTVLKKIKSYENTREK